MFYTCKKSGSSKLGDPYMKHTDSYGNICTHFVDLPQLISNYFAGSNAIDMHNQLGQDSLKIEKKRVTQAWFQLATTLVRYQCCWYLSFVSYHHPFQKKKR